jgi:hypothetical protein
MSCGFWNVPLYAFGPHTIANYIYAFPVEILTVQGQKQHVERSEVGKMRTHPLRTMLTDSFES